MKTDMILIIKINLFLVKKLNKMLNKMMVNIDLRLNEQKYLKMINNVLQIMTMLKAMG